MSTTQSLIKELFNEPSCSYSSNTTKKATCERLIPGSAISGCSFESAIEILRLFRETAHIIHAPSTCTSAILSPKIQEIKTVLSTTQMECNDIIFSGEKKLAESIDSLLQHYHPKVIFVYLTCVSSLIGEDIESIVSLKKEQWGVPIIAVYAAGFMGGMPFGARVAGVTLLEHLMGQEDPLDTISYDINLIGFKMLECEMVGYRALLEHLGFHIRWVFGAYEDIEKTYSAHCVKLNVLICAKPMITLARKMNERWNIPWVDVSFYGVKATSDAIRAIVEVFADGLLTRISEQYIFQKEQQLRRELRLYKEILNDKVVFINLKAQQSWQFIPLLKELGMRIAATSIEESTQDDIEKVYAYLAGEGMVLKEKREDFVEVIQDEKVDIFLCHYPQFQVAIESKIAFMTIDDNEKNYSGYSGSITFAQDIVLALNNPLFKVLYAKAPWE